jgi:hypothetical protein
MCPGPRPLPTDRPHAGRCGGAVPLKEKRREKFLPAPFIIPPNLKQQHRVNHMNDAVAGRNVRGDDFRFGRAAR